jgi:hypothetical protein
MVRDAVNSFVPENKRKIVKGALKATSPVMEKIVDMMQKQAIRDMKNFKNNRLLPKEVRDVLGDIVVASADPLNDLIEQA